jgi:hypothetical protein
MANFNQVNKEIKKLHTGIELVRGDGYAYFSGDNGFDQIDSIWAHQTITSTEDMTRMALEAIAEVYP